MWERAGAGCQQRGCSRCQHAVSRGQVCSTLLDASSACGTVGPIYLRCFRAVVQIDDTGLHMLRNVAISMFTFVTKTAGPYLWWMNLRLSNNSKNCHEWCRFEIMDVLAEPQRLQVVLRERRPNKVFVDIGGNRELPALVALLPALHHAGAHLPRPPSTFPGLPAVLLLLSGQSETEGLMQGSSRGCLKSSSSTLH